MKEQAFPANNVLGSHVDQFYQHAYAQLLFAQKLWHLTSISLSCSTLSINFELKVHPAFTNYTTIHQKKSSINLLAQKLLMMVKLTPGCE